MADKPTRKTKRATTEPSSASVGVVQSRNLIEGVHQIAGWLQNPDEIRLETYKRMVDTDETVATGVEFLALAATSRLGEYVNEKHPEAQEFIRQALEGMRGSFALVVFELLETAFWAGHAVAEIVVDYRDGAFWPREVVVLNPMTYVLKADLSGGPRHGQLETVTQWPATTWEAPLPAEKVLHLAHRSRWGNPYGTSRLRRAYKSWFIKDRTLQAWGLTMERYGTPLAVVRAKNPGTTVLGPDGRMQQKSDYLLGVLQNLVNSSGMVIDLEEAIEFLQSNRDVGSDFQTIQNHLNRMVMRSLLVPALVFENTETGSYSLGMTHFDVFLLGLESILQEVTEVLLEHFIRPILTWNFGENLESWGTWAVEPMKPDDLKLWSEVYVALTQAGFITPELREDLTKVRERFGFDPVDRLPMLPPPAAPFDGEPPTVAGASEQDLSLMESGRALLARTCYFANLYRS